MDAMFLLFLISGILMVALAIPMALGWIKPNPWYGVRVRSTLDDPRLWYAANRVAGRWLTLAGVVFLIAAVGLRWIPGITVDMYAIACLVVSVPLMMVATSKALKEARRFEISNKK
jgi:uncharacterized membrane protein